MSSMMHHLFYDDASALGAHSYVAERMRAVKAEGDIKLSSSR